MRKVIIDCDPGIDDALAITLAIKSQKLDILGLTICSGNVPAEIGAKNASRVLEICEDANIPVYIGEETPLVRKLITAQDTHGEDGLGEAYDMNYDSNRIKKGGVQFIIDTLKNNNDISIIALGPLTNIAMALRQNKEVFNNLNSFVSMGGAFRIHGNCSPVAEFNYWVDPDAANEVYQNLPTKIHMVGLDVTRKIVLTPNIIELMHRIDTKMAKFVEDITRFYIDFHWEYEKIIGCVINDPLAVAYFLDPSLCQTIESYVQVVTTGEAIGQSMVDSGNFYRKPSNAVIAVDVDSKRFMKTFLNTLFPHDEIEVEAYL
ncbi:MAG: nucleoside hydrolase [Epulopiscium sp. Nele67-Bin005]|nr:MAG: nucleoside hydrolase [Epulopiscium sp. Nele67-Bin005]